MCKGIAIALAKEGCNIIIPSHNSENLNQSAIEIKDLTGVDAYKYILDAEDPNSISVNH